MRRIVDTSVVVKWVLPEQDSDIALSLLGRELIAPDLLRAELAHALYKKVRAGEASGFQALVAQAQVEASIDFIPSIGLSRRALELSLELNHAAGDCFFLAVAELTGTPIVTADAKFVTTCKMTPYAPLVELLA